MSRYFEILMIAATAACGFPRPPDVGDASTVAACSSDTDCSIMGFPACDKTINQGTCEPCTATNRGVCRGTTPRCEQNACVACVDDVQDCGSGVCMVTGECADASRVIHASSGSSAQNDCGDTATPCTLVAALALATTGKDVIKLDDSGPFIATGFTVSNDVTIDARGSTLTRADDGDVLTVTSGKTLTILGGTILGMSGKNGHGIKCNGPGSTLIAVDVKIENNDLSGLNANMCTLNLTRITVAENSRKSGTFVPGINLNEGSITLAQSQIADNNGGGLAVSEGAFQIVGNVFSNNGPAGAGDPPSPVGGIMILAPGNPTNRIDFNTIVGNHAQTGAGPGLQCTADNLAVQNNIIYNNNDNAVAQFSGNCQPFSCDLGATTIDMNSNTHVDPMFTPGFHLNAMSPLLGKADPNADLTGIAAKDIDGEPRIKRPGAGADIGADQYYPPK